MKIYTKTGDRGATSLAGGERVDKWDVRVEAYGTVDELMAHTALLGDIIAEREEAAGALHDDIERIVTTLMTVAAIFAHGSGAKPVHDLDAAEIAWLEGRIDTISAGLEPLHTFTLPGGLYEASLAHVCRTVCRRAERVAAAANDKFGLPEAALIYLNRLSDYFYVASRELFSIFNVKERCWRLNEKKPDKILK